MADNVNPSLFPYLKACSVAVLLSMLSGFALGRVGVSYLPAALICLLVLLAMCARLLQSALAYFAARAYSLRVLLWGLFMAQLAGVLVAVAASGLLVLLVEILTGLEAWAPGGEVHNLLAAALAYPASVYLAARLFSEATSRDSLPARQL